MRPVYIESQKAQDDVNDADNQNTEDHASLTITQLKCQDTP